MFNRTRTVALAITLTATAALGLFAAAPASAHERSTSVSVVASSTSADGDSPAAHTTQLPEAKESAGTPMPVFMLVGLAAIFGSIFLVVGSGSRKTPRRR
jgi:cobalamin biosynthesis Mg chelatase CobN